MSHRVTTRVRILAGEYLEPTGRPSPRGTRRDYRALLQRASARRALRHDDAQSTAETPGGEQTQTQTPMPEARVPSSAERGRRRLREPAHETPSRHGVLIETAPYVDALTEHHGRSIRAIELLADRIGDFCSDPAVIGSGIWSTRIRLDPSILPDCALELVLSDSDLSLRFTADDPSSKALLFANREALRSRLEVLFAGLGLHRHIEIVV